MNKKEMLKIQGSQGVQESKEKDSQGRKEKGAENTGEVPEEVSPQISRYYQKQFERFMKVTEKKEDIQEAFFESIPGEKYEDDTLYTRLKRNPRKRH